MATRRGPKTPRGTPTGHDGAVATPHWAHASVCSWYSVIVGRTGGTSVTWCRRGVGSLPRKRAPHRRHWRGFTGTTASTSPSGTSTRAWAAWPGWAPGRRPEAGRRGRSTRGGSVEGGRDEFREVCSNRSVKAATWARNAVISTRCSTIRASSAVIRSCWSAMVANSRSMIASASSRLRGRTPPNGSRLTSQDLSHHPSNPPTYCVGPERLPRT